MITTSVRPALNTATLIARAALGAATTLRLAYRAHRNALLLHELSDAQLKDIGLMRSEIRHAVRASPQSTAG